MNSKEYEWADVTAVVAGRDITGLRAIKYSPKQDKEAFYGKGNKPISIQSGNKSYEGSITVSQSELTALKIAARNQGYGSVFDLSFNIVFMYGNPLKGDAIQTTILKGCEITECEQALKQGDKFMEIELPFIALDAKEA